MLWVATGQRCQKPEPYEFLRTCCGCWYSPLGSPLLCSVGLLIPQASSACEFFLWTRNVICQEATIIKFYSRSKRKLSPSTPFHPAQVLCHGQQPHENWQYHKPQFGVCPWKYSLTGDFFSEHWKPLQSIGTNVLATSSQRPLPLFNCWCFSDRCQGPPSWDLQGCFFCKCIFIKKLL